MTKEPLFQITEDDLETGLRGFPVGYCTTSKVDPQKGLFYMGQSVTDLAYLSPEEVIYLLYKGKKGSSSEVAHFFKDLHQRATLKPETVEAIESLPSQGHPMKLFCTALMILGMLEKDGDYREDCLNVIAKAPHLTAVVINHHAGWGKTPTPRHDLGYIENFTYMLRAPGCEPSTLAEVFRLFSILHFDHGGGNLSTFVGKAVASGLEDMYGSLAAAMCALAGPRHGKANQDCLFFLKQLLGELGENPQKGEVESIIRRKLEAHELIFGFGHAVLRVEDPRASVMYDFLQKHYPDYPLAKIALFLRTEGAKVLAENPKISDPYPNVDAVSGTMLAAAGFDYPDYFPVLFGMSRLVGIARQIVYERCEAREGKGTPIVRPKYLYRGP